VIGDHHLESLISEANCQNEFGGTYASQESENSGYGIKEMTK
jgi:hypothetical protein